MTAKSPDVSLIKFNNAKKKNFPGAYDYRIYMAKKAYEEISAHASSNTSIEIGGVMLGNIFHDNSGYFLEITNVITATNTENTMSNVTFTHETWTDIINKKDSKFPDKIIVGWYHSHPDFDIFLSQQDLHIHNNFFNQPHQVAFVIDPIRKREGFFIWKNGEAKILDQYWVGNERKFFIKEDTHAEPADDEKNDETDENAKKPSLIENILKWATIVLYVGAMLFMFVMYLRSNYYVAVTGEKLFELQSENQHLKQTIASQEAKSKSDASQTTPAGIEGTGNSTGAGASIPEPAKKANSLSTSGPAVEGSPQPDNKSIKHGPGPDVTQDGKNKTSDIN